VDGVEAPSRRDAGSEPKGVEHVVYKHWVLRCRYSSPARPGVVYPLVCSFPRVTR
jgi:hypothetical protein